jgi:hypothetical protein
MQQSQGGLVSFHGFLLNIAGISSVGGSALRSLQRIDYGHRSVGYHIDPGVCTREGSGIRTKIDSSEHIIIISRAR